MKKILTLTAAIVMAVSLRADDDEKIAGSDIKEVTVFLRGAQVYRQASVSIPKGVTVFVLDELGNGLNAQSMQASGIGNFTVVDVQYRYFYPAPEQIDNSLPPKIQREIVKLKDSLVMVRFEREEIQERKDALNRERTMLLNHGLMKGQGKVDSLELLKGSIEYFNNRLNDIAKRYHKIKIEEHKVTETENRMNQRLRELMNYNSNKPQPPRSAPKHQALITVVAEKATYGKLELNYLINNAGWSPMYDIKAKDAASPVELVYKASIYQNTGEDWKNIQLTVSNANPNSNNTKPYLPVWYIDYFVKQQAVQGSKKTMQYDAVKSVAPQATNESTADREESVEYKDNNSVTSTIVADYTQKMQNFTSVEFKIDLPYTILSDNKRHYVALDKHTLTTDYRHYLVPKIDPHAYVVARITDWENLNLLVGQANVYFGNTYVGRTVLNPAILTDTLELSLGRDESIFVKRTKLKDDTKDKFIGGKKTYTGSFEIELRNNNGADVDLYVEDQLPVSRNEDIEIELTQKDGGELNKSTGVITWKKSLKGREKGKISFTFTVKYDKDKTLTGL